MLEVLEGLHERSRQHTSQENERKQRNQIKSKDTEEIASPLMFDHTNCYQDRPRPCSYRNMCRDFGGGGLVCLNRLQRNDRGVFARTYMCYDYPMATSEEAQP